MKVHQLILNNLGSYYGTHRVPMSDLGLIFVRGKNLDEPKSPSNGSGKSTLFDVLDWCLFGEVPRGDSVKSIINEEAKKDGWAIAYLEDQGSWYCIFRYRQLNKESGVKFWTMHPHSVDGSESSWENETALDEKVTQAKIEVALGLDRQIFKAAVYRAQNDDFSFAEATDSERKELLTTLIPELAEVDSVKDSAKALLHKTQTDRAQMQGGMQQAQNELLGLQSQDWTAAEVQWRTENEKKQLEAKQQYDLAMKQLGDAQNLLLHLPVVQQQLQQLQQPAPSTAWQAEHDRRKEASLETHVRLHSLQTKYKELQGDLLKFSKGEISEGECKRCHMVVTGDHIQKETLEIQKELSSLLLQGKTARAELDQHEAGIKEAKEYLVQEQAANQAAVAEFGQRKGQLQGQIQQLTQLQNSLPVLQQNVNGWAYQITALQNEVWPGTQQQAGAFQRIAQLVDWIQVQTNDVALLEKREKHLLFWLDALTAKGLKNLIMDSRIEEMTEAANTWLQALTGGTTWVRFETQTMKGDGKLAEKMNIRIFRHNPDGSITERNFKSWSGGEKTRVARGVDQGLAKLIAARSTKAWELLILDEAFSRGLDGGGREAVFEQIQKMQNVGTVFVVDHTDLGGYFDKTLDVQIQNRRSQISIGGVSCLQSSSEPSSYLPSAN